MLHKSRITFLAIAVLFASLYSQMSTAADALILGIFPRLSATATHDAYGPLAQYLSKQLGREVKLETAKDQNAFWQAVKDKRYDIVHYNQLNYIESRDFGYEVVAMNEEFGKNTLAAALVVRKDSGITSIADLKGKTIVFGGGPKAMVAYLANVHLLKQAGLMKGDYKEEFAKSPTNAIMAVYYKQAVAGGAGDIGLQVQAGKEKIDADELMYLATGQQLPHLPWAVLNELGVETTMAVKNAFSSLKNSPEGASILASANLTNIVPAMDSDFDICRQIAKEVLNNNAN